MTGILPTCRRRASSLPFPLIGPDLLEKSHEQISVAYSGRRAKEHHGRDLKAGMRFTALEIQGENRNVVTALFDALDDQVIVITCPARAPCLWLQNGNLRKIQIGLPKMRHKIAYDVHGTSAIAGVDHGKQLHRYLLVLGNNSQFVSAKGERRNQKIVMVMQHVRHVYGMSFSHAFIENNVVSVHCASFFKRNQNVNGN